MDDRPHRPHHHWQEQPSDAAGGARLRDRQLDARATELHFHAFLEPLLRRLDTRGRAGLRALLVDSYEAGEPTWTADLRQVFLERNGYDVVPWLPALSVPEKDRAALEQRFVVSFRRTIAALFAERYYGRMAQLAHENGLELEVEPYGGPFSTAEVAALADLPMGEFWTGGDPGSEVALAAAAAGRTVVGAEAFTSWPDKPAAKWAGHPALFVPDAHTAFLRGINLLSLHSYALQPWGERARPGMTMGWWGSQFGRTQTWWEESRGFFDYLARCQLLLQQGRLVVPQETGFAFEGDGVAAVRRSSPDAEVFFVVNRADRPREGVASFEYEGKRPELWHAEDGRTEPAPSSTVVGGRTRVPLRLEAQHAVFVVFREAGGSASVAAPLPARPATHAVEVNGPWLVRFPSGLGAPPQIELPRLVSLASHPEPGVRFFSGTASYRAVVKVDGADAAGTAVLDLGEVREIARVLVNGKDAGLAWRPPYVLDLAGLLHAGRQRARGPRHQHVGEPFDR